MSNTIGGVESSYELEFMYYEQLPKEWREWLQGYEFNMSVESTYMMYLAGERLDDVKANTRLACWMYKVRMGWVDGHNGV